MESSKPKEKHLVEHTLGQIHSTYPIWPPTLLENNAHPCDSCLPEFLFLRIRREVLEASKCLLKS